MLRVENAEVRLFDPGTTGDAAGDADATFTGVESFETSRRIQVDRDQASIRNAELPGSATSFSDYCRENARVEIFVNRENDSSLTHRFTGLTREPTPKRADPGRTVLDMPRLDGFVAGIMANRFVSNAFSSQQVAGTSSSIVNTIVSNNCSELSTSGIDSVTDTEDATFRDVSVLEAVKDMADRTASIIASDDKNLKFLDREGLSSKFSLEASDIRLPLRSPKNITETVNVVRVNGGTGLSNAFDSQTTHDATTTVTNSTRKTQAVTVTKDNLWQVDLWVEQNASSTDNVVCRIQLDDGNGNPVAPDDRTQDIGRDTIPGNDLNFSSFNSFVVEAPLKTAQDVVIIVESDGSSGQNIGEDSGTGDLSYKLYYRFPIVVDREGSTATTYRRKEGVLDKPSAGSLEEAEAIAEAHIQRNQYPSNRLEFKAASLRAHQLVPGEIIDVDLPLLGFQGQGLVRRRDDEYEANTLRTDIQLESISTI